MRVPTQNRTFLIAAVITAALSLLYAPVLVKLAGDWWADENYSHGLLVPFVIAFIIWGLWDRLAEGSWASSEAGSWAGIILALLMLAAGTLGAELFTQRISLIVMLAAVTLFFWGRRVLRLLAVPFALLLLAIPIPQIVFNRVALPLQMWASQMAVWGVRVFEVPTLRKGNVIDILPNGGIQPISLEVVEACSGIRSLMTLVALALILGYFTRVRDSGGFANLTKPDLVRSILLMIAAVPIAVLTNAARVTATGLMTYEYGKQATEATVHDASGWLVYVAALSLLVAVNYVLKRLLRADERIADPDGWSETGRASQALPHGRVWVLIAVLALGGIGTNWLANRREIIPTRRPLNMVSTTIGDWRQRGSEIRFDARVEAVLGATDYTMREYTSPEGNIANIYIGYYETQRAGATYHSPQNCLPGAGWTMLAPEVITLTTPEGRTFTANRYRIENGIYKEVMIYWYQGRGRTGSSEYIDKLNTVLDSVTRGRTDGAIVRVMTDIGTDETAAYRAASSLAGELEDQLGPFIPE